MSLRSRLRVRTRLRSTIRRVWPPEPKPLILMYHRIADEPMDPWGLAVSSAHFEEQLQVLRRARRPLPLAEFVRALMAGTLPPNAVALTFDDGYADNLFAGKPCLAAADVPATVFLATGYLDRPEPFWWDELARLSLLGSGPQSFELPVVGGSMLFDLGTEPPAREDGTTPVESLKRRLAALRKIREVLRVLDDEMRRPLMVRLRSIFVGQRHRANVARAMTSQEVKTLVADGLVTIGAHTVTHPVLPQLAAAACRREISHSKTACESLIGAPVAAFAYPYGDFDPHVRDMVRASGFLFACSTLRRPVDAASDIFALPRIHVSNWNGDAFQQVLRSVSASY